MNSERNSLYQEEVKGSGTIYNFKDTDDLIQPEFPTRYIEKEHDEILKTLTDNFIKLKKQEKKSLDEYKKNFINNVKKEFQLQSKNEKAELNNLNKSRTYKHSFSKFDEEDEQTQKKNDFQKFEKIFYDEEKKAKKKLKEDFQKAANLNMKNSDFLLFLCLLRKKKEQEYESNPYIVDYSIDLDAVYQNRQNVDDNRNMFNNDLISEFSSNLNFFANERNAAK